MQRENSDPFFQWSSDLIDRHLNERAFVIAMFDRRPRQQVQAYAREMHRVRQIEHFMSTEIP